MVPRMDGIMHRPIPPITGRESRAAVKKVLDGMRDQKYKPFEMLGFRDAKRREEDSYDPYIRSET